PALAAARRSVEADTASVSAGIIMIILVSSTVANVLIEAADAPDITGVLDLFSLPFEFANRIHGESTDGVQGLSTLGTPAVVIASIAWTVLFAAVARWQYQRLEVRR
ncbi:MAG: hypothetical protein AAFZ07_28525, partial [Actinomycetota bacterium]